MAKSQVSETFTTARSKDLPIFMVGNGTWIARKAGLGGEGVTEGERPCIEVLAGGGREQAKIGSISSPYPIDRVGIRYEK
jgi:hypothetical protein